MFYYSPTTSGYEKHNSVDHEALLNERRSILKLISEEIDLSYPPNTLHTRGKAELVSLGVLFQHIYVYATRCLLAHIVHQRISEHLLVHGEDVEFSQTIGSYDILQEYGGYPLLTLLEDYLRYISVLLGPEVDFESATKPSDR
jgi:hypothetical protein